MDKHSNSLFFISYANLVAGLFFVILFVVAGVLLKNAFTKGDLQGEATNLSQERAKFEQDKEDFRQAQEAIYALAKKISTDKNASKMSVKDREMLALLASLDEKEQRLRGLNDEFFEAKK